MNEIIGFARSKEEKKEIGYYQYDVDTSLTLDYVVGQDDIVSKLRVVANQIKFAPVYQYWASSPPKGILFVGEPGTGKAQPLTSTIYTPSGPKNIGELEAGEFIIGQNGKPTKVEAVYDRGERPIYRVFFSDESFTDCCDEHLWAVQSQNLSRYSPNFTVMPLAEIRERIKRADGGYKYWIPQVEPVDFLRADLPIDPYLLGVLLGDGGLTNNVTLSTADPEILDNILPLLPPGVVIKYRSGYDYCLSRVASTGSNPLLEQIRKLGLGGTKSETKFIPKIYLYGSIQQRIALLAGLCDTDGSSEPGATMVDYVTISKQLALDIRELVQSLGGTCKIREKKTSYTYKGIKKEGQLAYRCYLMIPNHLMPYRLKRKMEKMGHRTKYQVKRFIDKIEYIGLAPARCIKVSSPDHLYVTDNFIVTHNTFTARCFASEVEATLFELRYQDFASHYVDHPIEFLNQIRLAVEFQASKSHALVFIDEIDAVLPSRTLYDIHEADRKRVNFFLTWMDGGMKEKSNVTFIGTTNRVEIMDPAALRPGRFSEKMEFKKLSKEDVCKCLHVHMKRKQKDAENTHLFKEVDDKVLIESLECLTGADVEQIIEVALLDKAKQHQANLKEDFGTFSAANPELGPNSVLEILTVGEKAKIPTPIGTEDLVKAIEIHKKNQIQITEEKTIKGFCP